MQAPERLGKYVIRRELGRGAMGVVYEGYDPFIERTVAIKVLRLEETDPKLADELRLRFRREAQAAGRLAHPGIVAIHEYGEDAERGAFIAMELVEGRDLKSLFDAGRRFSLEETGAVMRQLLGALQHAHDRGVVHRDIKPGNIILLEDGGVKIADFGIAKLDTSELTQLGSVLGTVSHMSPEQLTGDAVDRRSDVYSCGVILYQLLTGTRPFTGSPATVMHQVLHEPPAAPSIRKPSLPAALDPVVLTAMAKDPSQRYADARAFSAALEAALTRAEEEERTLALPTAPAPVPESALPTEPDATASPAARSRRTVVAVTVIALAFAAGLLWALRAGHERRPPQVAQASSAAAQAVATPASTPPVAPVAATAPASTSTLAAVGPTPSASAFGLAPDAASTPAPPMPAASARHVPVERTVRKESPASTVAPAPKIAIAEPPKRASMEPAKPAVAESAKPAMAEAAKPAIVEARKPATIEPAKPAAVEPTKPASIARASSAPVALAPAPASAPNRVALANPTPLPKQDMECLESARRGDAHCQFLVGRDYLAGHGVARDPVEGAKWYRKAAEQGLDVAQLALGQLYLRGLGVPRNATEGVSWIRKAATQGNARAQDELGEAYENGTAGPANHVIAVQWYRRAADQDLASAQYNLARMYLYGRGVFKDAAQAETWLEKAAAGGNPNAMVLLARMIQKGDVKPRDPDQAMRLYKEALKRPGLHDGNRDAATRALAAAR